MIRPHRRKRKHDPPSTPLAAKRLDIRPSVMSPTTQSSYSDSGLPSEPSTSGTALPPGNVTSPGSYLGRAEYVSGTVPIDEEDAKKYSSGRTSTLTKEDKRYLNDLHAFELPTRSLSDSLISSFMEQCYPWMPIVDFHELRTSEGSEPSLLLLYSVFVAGSRVSLAPNARMSGDSFYRRAKALYHLGYEKDPMTVIRSICLLLWFNNR